MSDKHNIPVSLKMNSREREALNRLSSLEGRKTSEMLRELVREAAQSRGVWPIGSSRQEAEKQTKDAVTI